MNNKMTYEAAAKELQEIVEALQGGGVSLDDLEKQVQRARELLTFCRAKLRGIRDKTDGLIGADKL